MKLLLLALLTACAYGTQKEPAKVGDADTRIVRYIWYPRPDAWRSSPWYRSALDTGTPFVVVITDLDYACVLPNGDVDMPSAGHAYRCVGGWRRASAVH